MTKQLKFLAIVCSITFSSYSQNATSVINGNWTSPSTWNCVCVPVPGATVVINHTVTLNTNFGYTSGSITINANGALLDDIAGKNLWINGGGFSNNGNVDVRYLLTTSGSLSNGGTLTARSFSNTINFTNTGVFKNIDSMVNNAILINNGSFLTIDSILNTGTFINNGISVYNQFTNDGTYANSNNLTFTDITNNGTLTNTDSIIGLNSMWNQGKITNSQNAYLKLNKSLLNKKLVSGTASINNNGIIKILDSYYNYDTVRGTIGSINVQDSSVNYGFMQQTFDFCDVTPLPSPNIDFNFGTVSPGITYCVFTGIEETAQNNFILFPNPASTELTVSSLKEENYQITIYNYNGKTVYQTNKSGTINLSEFPAGLYFISITNPSNSITKKFLVIK